MSDTTTNGGDTRQRSRDEVRADIEAAREQLGETVEALAYKADVKGRARERVDEVKETLSSKVHTATSSAKQVTPKSVAGGAGSAAGKAKENPVPLALAGAFAAGILVGWLLLARE